MAMERTQFDDTLLPVFGELDMAIFTPSIDLAAPSEAPDDAILVPDITWPTYLAASDWINEQACLSGSGFGAVKILQLNMMKSRAGMEALIHDHQSQNLDVLLIQEPPTNADRTYVNHSAWRLYRPTVEEDSV